MKRKYPPTLEERFEKLTNLMTTPQVEGAVVWVRPLHGESMSLCTVDPVKMSAMLDGAFWREEFGEEPYLCEELFPQHFNIPDAIDELRRYYCSFAAVWQLTRDRPTLAYSNDLSTEMAATVLGRVVAEEYYAASIFA